LQLAEDTIDVVYAERRRRRRRMSARVGDCRPADADAPLSRPAGEEADRDRNLVRRKLRQKRGQRRDLVEFARTVRDRARYLYKLDEFPSQSASM